MNQRICIITALIFMSLLKTAPAAATTATPAPVNVTFVSSVNDEAGCWLTIQAANATGNLPQTTLANGTSTTVTLIAGQEYKFWGQGKSFAVQFDPASITASASKTSYTLKGKSKGSYYEIRVK